MSLRTRIFAAVYDTQMRRAEKAGLTAMRKEVLAGATGDVLEIGAGTGGNLVHYPPAVTSVTVTEPDQHMFTRLERRARASRPTALVLRAPAEDLPFEDRSFDTVVSTLVLCGVDDQPRAVREIRRVLRPGGRFLFLEHLRATDPAIARKQDAMNWFNRAVVCCDCNRPTLDVVTAAGFGVTALRHTELPKAPAFVRPTVLCAAVSPAAADGAAELTRSVMPDR